MKTHARQGRLDLSALIEKNRERGIGHMSSLQQQLLELERQKLEEDDGATHPEERATRLRMIEHARMEQVMEGTGRAAA